MDGGRCQRHGKGFPTWRRRVGRGLVDLGWFAVEGSTSHYHIVVPRKRVHVVDIALPVAYGNQN